MQNDILNELGTNFIEYAVAVNTDRAIPNANDGLKPVAKRILYGAYEKGFKSDKPHVKCANIVGNVMADWHPHGDSSIYGALVRMTQPWVMRYPLLDFHGANGNIDGDPPAAYRYTEAKLNKFVEEGMLDGIKKNAVDFIPNYSEAKDEPIELPSLFPNLLCNPNSGIGVAMACSWAPHNLREVGQAICDYINGKEPTLPGPDFPTGGIVINAKDIPSIMATGHGSVKIRGKYEFEGNNIVFTEIPYGTNTEALMEQIGKLCEENELVGITDIRNESNKKGMRLVLECSKDTSLKTLIHKLFAKTNLQTSFSYNQVALVDKVPTDLNLKQAIEIYYTHNIKCLLRITEFEFDKAAARAHIIEGLLKSIDKIDEVISLIKNSNNKTEAQNKLITFLEIDETQANAILDMKLAKLTKIDKNELVQELHEKEDIMARCNIILTDRDERDGLLIDKIQKFCDKYGDDRRTQLTNIEEPKGEEKEIADVEPEKCVIIVTKGGTVKRIPSSSFRAQKRNGKGIKSQEDITEMTLRTNTVDYLMIFSNTGKVYKTLVNNIPAGTNSSKGTPIRSLVDMEPNEKPSVVYSLLRGTSAKYVFFVTKNGMVKKTSIEEYTKSKRGNSKGLQAIKFRENDELASVCLLDSEEVLLVTKNGKVIRIKSSDIEPSSRTTIGVKGINLDKDDEVCAAQPIRDESDTLALFLENGLGKRVSLSEFPTQNRGGKGLIGYKTEKTHITAIALVNDDDLIAIHGNTNTICIYGKDIPVAKRGSVGVQIISNNHIVDVTKVC